MPALRLLRSIAAAFTFAFLSALSAPVQANAILQQIGVSGENNLKQISLAIHDGDSTYTAGDGSVRTIIGDGSVRFISTGPDQPIALCFRNVSFPGGIADGTSNTIMLSETIGLQVTPGYQLPITPVRNIIDGTSNTIIFNDSPTSVCLGNTFLGGAVFGDPSSPPPGKGIEFGDKSNFDICFSKGNVGITDGTSNTILFGETRNNLCYTNISVDPSLTVSVLPEPSALGLFGAALLAAGFLQLRRKKSQAPQNTAAGIDRLIA